MQTFSRKPLFLFIFPKHSFASYLFLYLFFFDLASPAYAQWKGFEPSVAGRGDAFVSLANSPMGGLYNPAGLALTKQREVSATYLNRFQLKETNLSGIGYVDPITIPNNYGAFGITLTNFGFDLYHKTSASLSYSILLANRISIGFTSIYDHTFIHRYGNTNSIRFDLGTIAIIYPELILGFSAKRVAGFGILLEGSSPSFSLGASYLPLENVLVSVDVEFESSFPLCFKAGIAYEFIDILALSVGITTAPLLFTGGINFYISKLAFHYGIAYHTQLGPSHAAGVSFLIPNPPQKESHFGKIKSLKYHIHQLYQR